MASLSLICPTTHQRAPTGIQTDVQSLRTVWKATLKVKCPRGGEMHEMSVRETYLNGGIHTPLDKRGRPDGFYQKSAPSHDPAFMFAALMTAALAVISAFTRASSSAGFTGIGSTPSVASFSRTLPDWSVLKVSW
jgi:hypothetical protein